MPGGGDLRSVLSFAERVSAPDGAGNYQEDWIERVITRARVAPARGTEQLDADRSQGRGMVSIRVRSSAAARQITSDWRATDMHSGMQYNIRSVRDPDQGGSEHGRWLEMAAEHGLAVG